MDREFQCKKICDERLCVVRMVGGHRTYYICLVETRPGWTHVLQYYVTKRGMDRLQCSAYTSRRWIEGLFGWLYGGSLVWSMEYEHDRWTSTCGIETAVMVSSRWSVFGGQLTEVSSRWWVVNYRWSAVGGRWSMDSSYGQWSDKIVRCK